MGRLGVNTIENSRLSFILIGSIFYGMIWIGLFSKSNLFWLFGFVALEEVIGTLVCVYSLNVRLPKAMALKITFLFSSQK